MSRWYVAPKMRRWEDLSMRLFGLEAHAAACSRPPTDRGRRNIGVQGTRWPDELMECLLKSEIRKEVNDALD